MTDKTVSEEVTNKLLQMDSIAAKTILEYKEDETAVVGMGCEYVDKMVVTLKEIIKIAKETPSKTDISEHINNFKKVIIKTEAQKKWTAEQWIDWAKAVKDKK